LKANRKIHSSWVAKTNDEHAAFRLSTTLFMILSSSDPSAEARKKAQRKELPAGAGLMARRLKTYQTSLGFFDLAIAAPSMKAAAEAWGAKTNIFKQGFGKETNDPDIVAATMAKPGVVLRRPVGSNGPFSEHAELPKHLIDKVKQRSAKPRPKTEEPPAREIDDKAARAAALAFEREQERCDSARRKEEAGREKERKRREQAIAKAERALEEAKRDHEAKAEAIERERAALDRRSQAEEARWEKQKEKLATDLRRARD
jgi:hypothetical protein